MIPSVSSPVIHSFHRANEGSGLGMLIPTLKCVAWNARLLVIGFAGGTIEKVC